MDFTIKQYQQLLESLQNAGFFFQTFAEYIQNEDLNRDQQISAKVQKNKNSNPPNQNKLIVLRHDVDARPQNSLRFAQIQTKRGIKGTYYFRIVPQSYNEKIIREIANLGHEIGYHYETMDTCTGDVDKAYDEFCRNLEKLREIAPINTISMHGSPLSKFDNRDIWKKYDYHKLGMLGEPYFDINFNELFYLTDTGRRWDGYVYNIRDKATKENPVTNKEFLNLRFQSTSDIIKAIESGTFPYHAMLNFHPQRWNNKSLPWIKELFWQNIKNQIKRILLLWHKNRGKPT